MLAFYILIFIASAILLALSSNWIIDSLIGVAKHLKWREFVIGFIIMSLATSTPNLFVGISSAIRHIPELSFGDVVGGNVVDLTLGTALGALLGQGIIAESRMVQTSSFLTLGIGVLPLLLALDGNLNRVDGIILILAFFFYTFWLFSKDERFRKIYGSDKKDGSFLKHLLLLFLSLGMLILGSQGIVTCTIYFAKLINVPIGLIGILLVGLGNCLPELYFTSVSARKGQSWMILGDLMGSVITCATLVLGIVVLICPIMLTDFSPYLLARAFLIISLLFFLIFLRTNQKITTREAIFLLSIYIVFLLSEIFLR